MILIFIVNGVDVLVEVAKTKNLHLARDKALQDSNNTGRPFDEWEIHDSSGLRLDPGKTVEVQGLQNGDRLFLNLEVGFGGS